MRYALLKAQLVLDESLRLKPYVDTVGKVTIGVGRNLTDCGISETEAYYLLNNDVDSCELDLASLNWPAKLDPVRFEVLLNMRFNLGPKGFREFVQTLKYVRAGRYIEASAEMLLSTWAQEVGARAERLSGMMRSGERIAA